MNVPVTALPGHTRDQDDADRLRHDPAITVAAKSSGGSVPSDGSDGLPSRPMLWRFVDQLSREENLDVLKRGILWNGLRRIREGSGGSEDFLVINVDEVPFLADGQQPGSRYCGYVGQRCYSALVAVSGESGDILCARLRRRRRTGAGFARLTLAWIAVKQQEVELTRVVGVDAGGRATATDDCGAMTSLGGERDGRRKRVLSRCGWRSVGRGKARGQAKERMRCRSALQEEGVADVTQGPLHRGRGPGSCEDEASVGRGGGSAG